MNKKQLIVLWAGILIIVMFIFPPVTGTVYVGGISFGGFGFIYSETMCIDTVRLAMHCTTVSLITGGLYTLNDKRTGRNEK